MSIRTRLFPATTLTCKNAGWMSHGASDVDLYRRVAVYIDRIFKGAKPGDLPIDQPSKMLVINLKTAKALGLKLPHFAAAARG